MAIELVTCSACRAKNASHRTICLSCGASLAASEESPPPTETQFTSEPAAEPLLERVGRYVKNLTIEQATKLGIIASVLLVSFSVFYYLVVFLPRREEARKELQKQEQIREEMERIDKLNQAIMLDKCLLAADKDSKANWAAACRTESRRRLGLDTSSNCSLPLPLADRVNTLHKESRDECYKEYPQR